MNFAVQYSRLRQGVKAPGHSGLTASRAGLDGILLPVLNRYSVQCLECARTHGIIATAYHANLTQIGVDLRQSLLAHPGKQFRVLIPIHPAPRRGNQPFTTQPPDYALHVTCFKTAVQLAP